MASQLLVAVNTGINHITAYPLDTEQTIVWQGENTDYVVEGCLFEVDITREWMFGSTHFITGPITSQRIDIPALGVTPLRVRECIKCSKEYEMEQVIPGWEPNVFGSDPILEAVELKNKGEHEQARNILRNIIKEDIRCIDAHVHLGNFAFGAGDSRSMIRVALNHYSVAVLMGKFFLGDNFKGTLPWGWINNRPYLRALHGQCICFWALGEFKEAMKVAKYILKVNPMDNQGIRFLTTELKEKKPYDASTI